MTGLFSSSVVPVVVGANHRSSTLALRDRIFLEEHSIPEFLSAIHEQGIVQAMALATCDRVEVHFLHENPQVAIDIVRQELARHAGIDANDLKGQLYAHSGEAAITHIFRVTSALDSLMVGEPQVFGQVKDAYRLAQESKTLGAELDRIYQAAFSAAKRVRSETKVGERPVSIASVAVQVAKDLHGDLSRCKGLLIGAGDMGELTAQNLIEAGVKSFSIVHPFDGRAKMVARTLGCHAEAFDKRDKLACEADIILTSVNKRQRIVSPEMVSTALKVRKNKPIFLVDTGIPGDIDPAVNDIDGAFLYDLHDLERIAMEGRASREVEAHKARAIVLDEVERFLKGRDERAAVPSVSALRERFEEERQAVLAECAGDAEKATRLLVNRLLHDPSEALREMAAETSASHDKASLYKGAQDALARLFRLKGSKEK